MSLYIFLFFFFFFGSKWNNHSSKNTENFGKLLTGFLFVFFFAFLAGLINVTKFKKMTFGGQWSFLDYGQNFVENAKNWDL